MDKELYFDGTATTPVDPIAQAAVDDILKNHFHNPSSQYAVEEKRIIDEAAKNVADFIGAKPEEIYFTSGATESNNWAIRGWVDAQDGICKVITSKIEHPSVYNTVKKNGSKALNAIIGVNCLGYVNIAGLEKELSNTEYPILVTIGMVNNELGTIQDMKTIVEEAHKYGAIVHTDATQYLPHVKVDVKKLDVDMLSGSGHKFGCPKGIGFLYIREGLKINNLMFGGKQQQGARPGTENIAYIHALGEVLKHKVIPDQSFMYDMRECFAGYIHHCLQNAGFLNCCYGPNTHRGSLPNIISLRIIGVKANELLTLLAEQKVYISAGSACSSGLNKPSRVLKAIGLSDENASEVIRISFSEDLSMLDMHMFVDNLVKACKSYKLLVLED